MFILTEQKRADVTAAVAAEAETETATEIETETETETERGTARDGIALAPGPGLAPETAIDTGPETGTGIEREIETETEIETVARKETNPPVGASARPAPRERQTETLTAGRTSTWTVLRLRSPPLGTYTAAKSPASCSSAASFSWRG